MQWVLKALGIIEIPSSGFLLKMNRFLCGSSDALKEICAGVIFAFSGYDSEQFDRVSIVEKEKFKFYYSFRREETRNRNVTIF